MYQMRRSVVVHGEVLVIRKLVVAGIVSAEKTYLDSLLVMREVSNLGNGGQEKARVCITCMCVSVCLFVCLSVLSVRACSW